VEVLVVFILLYRFGWYVVWYKVIRIINIDVVVMIGWVCGGYYDNLIGYVNQWLVTGCY